MKKLFLLILVSASIVSASAQIDGFFPQFGQDAQWTVNDKFELVHTGAVAPAPAAAIATTFEGLVSDGIGSNDFTNLTITFDGLIIDAGTSTKVFLAFNGVWGEKAVNLEFNQWLCQATTNYDYGVMQWMINNPGAYQAAVVKNGYNKIEINVSATGLISCKVNNFVCDKPYQAPLASLKPTGTNTFYALFGNDITGFKMKNLVVTKGSTTNKYFNDPEAGVSKLNERTSTLIPAGKGMYILQNNAIGSEYQIVNTVGQQIQRGIIRNNQQNINLSSANAGAYMLMVKGEKSYKFFKN